MTVSREEIARRLDAIAPAVEALARHQEQCDMDGVMVKVSRQAVDEVVNAVNQLAIDTSSALRAAAELDHRTSGELPERETWWLVERMGTGQYVKHGAAGTRHNLTDNAWHAERWPNERSAFEFARLSESPWAKELRATEHIFINKAASSLPDHQSALDQRITELVAPHEAINRVVDAMSAEMTKELVSAASHAQEGHGSAYIVRTINFLREEEGDSVTILCDNPDFNGQPNCAIECNGQWTEWQDRRFTGETLIEALSAAYLQCVQLRAAADYGKKWSSPVASQAGSEASSGADKALADKLQALCCAETEGKFFDLVTDSIQQILAALRRPAPEQASSGVLWNFVKQIARCELSDQQAIRRARELLRAPEQAAQGVELDKEPERRVREGDRIVGVEPARRD